METPKRNEHEVAADSDTVVMKHAARWEHAEARAEKDEEPTVATRRLSENTG